jgi:hypothetical protein
MRERGYLDFLRVSGDQRRQHLHRSERVQALQGLSLYWHAQAPEIEDEGHKPTSDGLNRQYLAAGDRREIDFSR